MPATLMRTASTSRWRIDVTGTVQGVGFRPFVYTLARACGLAGWVCNTGDGVTIEVEGIEGDQRRFVERLRADLPPLASIEELRSEAIPVQGETGFAIRHSEGRQGARAAIPPDVATCPACAAEIADPTNRRYRYPFTNCTNCGPRFTIIRAIPYDRPQTTMAGFQMCSACQAEYDDPADRRFHAQPNACPVCGPHLALDGHADLDDAGVISEAARLLRAGAVLAIKGLGGYHLACDATHEDAVRTLRARKGRAGKPFALMAPDMETARRLCAVNADAEALLTRIERPIVLLPALPDNGIAASVAPGVATLGLMLPYTPLHHLLLAEMAGPLVMTSGNLSDEPIAHRDDEARARLGHLADVFLTHDRPIHVACDDSVVRPHRAGPMPIRRARGHVPTPIAVAPGEELPAVLACGGDLKHTFCLTRGGMALMSQHLGDLENVVTLEHARAMIDHFCAFYDVHPAIIAHDLHPDYHATRLARSLPAARHVAVQHHHAHIAACMAEHRLAGPVIGIAFDGTGLGTDGVIWGGEVLVADFQGFQRVGHLAEFALPGGEAAIRRPGRVALAHLLRMGLDAREAARLVPGLTDAEADVVALQVARGLNAPRTTSMGRLFDAVSALLGICAEVTYEGQAAIELEAAAQAYSPFPEGKGVGGLGPRGSAEHLPDSLLARSADAPWLLDPALLIHALLDGRRAGVPVGELAAGFHAAIAAATADLCARVRDDGGPNQVALSGGVFQNVLLLDSLTAGLVARGFSVFRHQQVPCNDGGLSLGQAMIAARRR